MKVGSLFSGIGGIDLGFERAGFEIAWQVEIESFCRRVLAKHWPGVPKYEDVRDVGSANLEWVDVIVGGFPCQDISIAGKGAGLEGARSGLWREYARIIGELRPAYAVVENTPALLHRGIDRVLGELAASGYDAEWQCLSAAAFGAPHIRERLFIIAYPTRGEDRRVQQSWVFPNPGDGSPLLAHANSKRQLQPQGAISEEWGWSGNSSQAMGNAEGSRLAQPSIESRCGTRLAGPEYDGLDIGGSAEFWAIEPPVGRMVDGLSGRIHRLRGLGNAVVPQVAQYVAECVKAHAEAGVAA